MRDSGGAYEHALWRETMEGMGSLNVAASVLLVIGYPLALGVLAWLRPVLAERRVWWFAALEAATASITAGWLLHRRPLPAAINGAALIGFAIAWLITGQRTRSLARQARCRGAEGRGLVRGQSE